MISKFELGRIVGLLEGEGTISISRHTITNHQGKKYITFTPKVEIFNTKKALIIHLKKLLVYGIIYHRDNHSRVHRSDTYTYSVNQYKVKEFLEMVYPYLIIKKKQAKIVLNFINIRKNRKTRCYGQELRNQFEKLTAEIRVLNDKAFKFYNIPYNENEIAPSLNTIQNGEMKNVC